MTVIVVSNTGSIPRAEILAVLPSTHEFHINERMKLWIGAGNTKESWSRLTTLVYVTDKTPEELSYLLEPYISNVTIPPQRIGNKYHFSEPNTSDPMWIEMYHNGEIHKTWDEIKPHVRERV